MYRIIDTETGTAYTFPTATDLAARFRSRSAFMGDWQIVDTLDADPVGAIWRLPAFYGSDGTPMIVWQDRGDCRSCAFCDNGLGVVTDVGGDGIAPGSWITACCPDCAAEYGQPAADNLTADQIRSMIADNRIAEHRAIVKAAR